MANKLIDSTQVVARSLWPGNIGFRKRETDVDAFTSRLPGSVDDMLEAFKVEQKAHFRGQRYRNLGVFWAKENVQKPIKTRFWGFVKERELSPLGTFDR